MLSMNQVFPRPLNVVSFDLDQTLVFHTGSSRQKTVLSMLSARGHEVTEIAYREAMRVAREFYNALGYRYAQNAVGLRVDYIRLCMEILGVHEPAVIDEIVQYYLAYDREPGNFYAPDAARVLLADLRACGCQLAVISSNLDAQQRADYCGLSEFFAYFLTPMLGQPKPELFRILLERTGLRPEQILHIGDDPILDVLAARSNGIDAVLFDSRHKYDGLAWPAVAHTYAELRQFFFEIPRS